jgi:serine/threonine-protein kinase
LTSPAIALASDVSTRWLGSAEFAVSENGTLILGVGSRISGGESIGWLDRSGQSNVIDERLATDVGDFDFVSLSPDGRFIATEIQSGSDGAADEEHRIQIYDIEQTTLYQLSFEGQRNRMPRWLADGRVAYLSDQGEVNGIYAQPFDRSGAPELLFETSGAIAGFDAVPLPGVPLVLWTSRGEGPTDSMPQGVYVVPDTPDGSLTALVASRFMEAGAAISPDGRWVAYVSDESERPEIFVRAYPDGGRPFPISTEGGIAPTWGASSETLFYVEPNRMVQAVELEVSPSGVRVASRSELFPAAGVESNDRAYSSRLDVSLDGQSLLAVLESNRASASSADVGHVVVLNVFAEIEQRLEATGR